MRVKIKPVNDMAVSDEHLNIIILKKPKRRYRQIIKAYYRRMVELGRRDTGWTMRISAAAPATGTKNAVESFNVSMRVQKALQ